jgi:hypothetical protein
MYYWLKRTIINYVKLRKATVDMKNLSKEEICTVCKKKKK